MTPLCIVASIFIVFQFPCSVFLVPRLPDAHGAKIRKQRPRCRTPFQDGFNCRAKPEQRRLEVRAARFQFLARKTNRVLVPVDVFWEQVEVRLSPPPRLCHINTAANTTRPCCCALAARAAGHSATEDATIISGIHFGLDDWGNWRLSVEEILWRNVWMRKLDFSQKSLHCRGKRWVRNKFWKQFENMRPSIF